MSSGRTDGSNCPHCNSFLDGWTAMDQESQPSPGDVTVCAECGEICQFGEGLVLEELNPDTISQCDLIELQQAQQIVREHIARNKLQKH